MFFIRTSVAKKRNHVRPRDPTLVMADTVLNQVAIWKVFGALDEFVHHEQLVGLEFHQAGV